MLDVYKLQVFMAVAQAGSFSRAAESLYLTQSAVSQHIKDLESQLGVRLFDRGRHGARLTESGRTLMKYAQQILWLLAEAESAVTDVQHLAEGEVRIGATSTAAGYLLPVWTRHFHRQFPALRVSLQTAITEEIVTGLVEQQMDLGFVEGDWAHTPGIAHTPLHDTELSVVVGPHHPWWGQERISLRDLDRQLFIAYSPRNPARTWEDELFAQYQIAPMVIAEYDEPEAIKRAVIEGMEAAILPCCVVRDDVDAGRLHLLRIDEQPLKRPVELLWNNTLPLKPTSRAFLESLSDQFPDLLARVDEAMASNAQAVG